MQARLLLALTVPAFLVYGEISHGSRKAIDELTGATGIYTADEDVYRVAFPRSDLKVTIEGRAAHPFLGFSSWAAFTPEHGGTTVM